MRLAVLVLLGTLAGLPAGVLGGAFAAPASAAGACTDGRGVTVVVDPHQLGGSPEVACVASGGGRTASQLMGAAGHTQRYATREPGFVCRVDDRPADAPCVNPSPSDAYWSLWWSDGSGSWRYASLGPDSLQVPAGGSVAWSWQGQAAKAEPGVAPGRRAATPTRGASPSTGAGGAAGSDDPGGASGTGTDGARPGAPATSAAPGAPATSGAPGPGTPSAPGAPTSSGDPAVAAPTGTAAPTAPTAPSSPGGTASSGGLPALGSQAGTADDTAAADQAGGLPGWVALVLVALLATVGAGTAVVRRRAAGGSDPGGPAGA